MRKGHSMTTRFNRILMAALVCAAASAHAEPFVYLDRFNEVKTINNDLWMENEITRVVLNKSLYFGLGVAGLTTQDLGTRIATQSLTVANSAAVTEIAADVTVDFVDAPASCGDSRAVGYAKLRMGGSFFNVGTTLPNNATGDVMAQVVISRLGNSVDPVGVMNVTGEVNQCKNINCLTYTTLGSVDLGKAEQGLPIGRLTMIWDQPTKSFVFQRKASGPKLAVYYTVPDSSMAGRPAKTFSVRNSSPNCADSMPALVTKITSKIDNVAVNEGAGPQ
jgi:hypothetical protein